MAEMNQVSDEELEKLSNFLKKADIEIIAAKTGFSVSYVWKVLRGTKYNLEILVSVSERALLKKTEQDKLIKKFKYKVSSIAGK